MALEKKFSELPDAGTLTGDEKLVALQDGANVNIELNGIASFIGASAGAVTSVAGRTGAVVLTGADIAQDGTHRFVSDAEKANWNAGAGLGYSSFDLRNYGFIDDANADNTPALQAAINACSAALGSSDVVIPFRPWTIKIKGALITSLNSVNPNCQVYVPLKNVSGDMVTITIRGEVEPNFSTEGISGVPRNYNGCILESTIQGTGTLPCVLGTPWANQGVVGDRNYCKLVLKNLIIRTSTMSGATHIVGTMSGVNVSRFIQFNTDKAKADISSPLNESVKPTNETYGFIMPDVNNKAELEHTLLYSEGYKYGITVEEHLHIGHYLGLGCVYAMKINNNPHAARIEHATIEACNYGIKQDGNTKLSFGLYETEHSLSTGKWYDYVGDIAPSAGSGLISIFMCNVVESFIGQNDNGFNGNGANYRIFNGAGENVQYGTTPPPASILEDDFNRADSTASIGSLITPVTPWIVDNGTWGITANKGYNVSESSTGSPHAEFIHVDAGQSDFTYEVEMNLANITSVGGMIFRYQDASNYLYIEATPGGTSLYKRVGGTYTTVQNVGNSIATGLVTMKVVTNGSAITVYRNNNQIITQTVTDFLTETKIGLSVFSGTSLGGGVTFDNLSLY